MDKIIVIKYGGHAMEVPQISEAFARDLAELGDKGFKFVIVHGGGPHISRLLDRLNIESEFSGGLRVTDSAALEAVEMALCGQVNKATVRFLEKTGVPAAGISGQDGMILQAEAKDPRLGRVGDVVKVDPRLILNLLQGGFTPVVAPLALDKNLEPLNINADTAAGAIAGALKARFILLSDVPGVLDSEGALIPRLDEGGVNELIADGVINGGMIPKVRACLAALDSGCGEAAILDGRLKNSLKLWLYGQGGPGTAIYRQASIFNKRAASSAL